jgi:hypothetical protein
VTAGGVPIIPLPAEAEKYPVFYEAADDQHRRETRALFWLASQTTGAILEIGTHNGIKAMELARTFPSRRIITVDYTGPNPTMHPAQLSEQPSPFYFGERCRNLPNVVCIDRDSRRLDYLALMEEFGTIGFAFIDGDHSDEGVKADTRNALWYATFRYRLSRLPVIVAWHDFADYGPEYGWVGVKRVLLPLAAAGLPLTEIEGTRTAFARFN